MPQCPICKVRTMVPFNSLSSRLRDKRKIKGAEFETREACTLGSLCTGSVLGAAVAPTGMQRLAPPPSMSLSFRPPSSEEPFCPLIAWEAPPASHSFSLPLPSVRTGGRDHTKPFIYFIYSFFYATNIHQGLTTYQALFWVQRTQEGTHRAFALKEPHMRLEETGYTLRNRSDNSR